VIPRKRGWSYLAVLDPGTRDQIWTFVVVTRDAEDRVIVADHGEWVGRPGAPPLIPETLCEVRDRIAPYGLAGIWADQWVPTRLREVAEEHKIPIWRKEINAEKRVEHLESLRVLVELGRIVLPEDPQIRDDLLTVRRRLTVAGVGAEVPLSPDGRHSNYARVLALACSEPCLPAPGGKPAGPPEEEAIIARAERDAKRGPFDRSVDRQKFWRRPTVVGNLRSR
jgi:hypothetical protein